MFMTPEPTEEQLRALLGVCSGFVEENKISCPEAVCQCDWVITNAYEFIEDICDVVGYDKTTDE
jgi:hypothetical protein